MMMFKLDTFKWCKNTIWLWNFDATLHLFSTSTFLVYLLPRPLLFVHFVFNEFFSRYCSLFSFQTNSFIFTVRSFRCRRIILNLLFCSFHYIVVRYSISFSTNYYHFTRDGSAVLLLPIESCGKLDLLCGGFSFELR